MCVFALVSELMRTEKLSLRRKFGGKFECVFPDIFGVHWFAATILHVRQITQYSFNQNTWFVICSCSRICSVNVFMCTCVCSVSHCQWTTRYYLWTKCSRVRATIAQSFSLFVSVFLFSPLLLLCMRCVAGCVPLICLCIHSDDNNKKKWNKIIMNRNEIVQLDAH